MGLFGGIFKKILGVAVVAAAVVGVAATGGLGAGAAGLASAAFGSGVATFASSTFGRLLFTVALTLAQRFLVKAPGGFSAGIQTGTAVSGEDQPELFIVGRRYATSGAKTYPTLAYDKDRFLVQRLELSDLPGCQLIRVAVDGEWVELVADIGRMQFTAAPGSKYAGHLWMNYYDGSQTAADQVLLDEFGAHPDYPYDASMVMAGKCYGVVVTRYNQELFHSIPKIRFELTGIPMYDPRKDSSVGGSGTHRWADKATWQATGNAKVVSYNIFRGIEFPGGDVWGGNVEAEDLPLDAWFAAMNDDDEQVQIGGGIGNRYECGFEIKVDMEPASVLEELSKADSGLFADVGGVWFPRTGAPDLPVLSLTDDDMLSAEPVGFNPHGGQEQTANALTVLYPDPEQIYEPREAPKLTNATWEAEDGGVRRMREIALSAVPFPGRAQIISRELHADERRQIRHVLAVPHTMAFIRPLQTIDFTSDHFGHAGKDFEVSAMVLDLLTLGAQLVVREVDPADFTPPVIEDTTLASPVAPVVGAIAVDGWAVTAVDIADASGTARRPGFSAVWIDPPVDAMGAQIEMRVTATAVMVKVHPVSGVQDGSFTITEGVLPGVLYDLRMRYVVPDRPATWSAWVTVQATGTRLIADDLATSAVITETIAANAVTVPLFASASGALALTTSDFTIISVTNASELELAVSPVQITFSFRLVFTPPISQQIMPVIMTLERGGNIVMSTTINEFSPDTVSESLQRLYSFTTDSIPAEPFVLPETYRVLLRKNSALFDVDATHRFLNVIGLKR